MRVFIEIENLEQLEEEQQWDIARKTLFQLWKEDKDNVDKAIRLIAECWRIQSLWDCCINDEGLKYEDFQDVLIEVTEYGLKHFTDNINFLIVVGYMTNIIPYLFYKENKGEYFIEWENKGKSMLQKAYHLSQNNILAKVLFYGSINDVMKGNKAKEEIKPILVDLFPGNTSIEQYFREMLLCEYE